MTRSSPLDKALSGQSHTDALTAFREHAVGISRVPYDGYAALLHRGEMVLTSAQASAYRAESQPAPPIDYDALATAMAGLSLTMDSKVVGKIIERSVSSAQGARYAREQRGLK